MKKQVLAGVLLAAIIMGGGASDSYAAYNEYRGNMPENGGDLSSPFVFTEINLRDNYMKVVYNGGMEGEVELKHVDILTWNPENADICDEDRMDWNMPDIRYSIPPYAYVVYNKAALVYGSKFAKGVEETISGSEMMSPISGNPTMKLYYSLRIGPNTRAESFYTGKINYERCAGSRAFNREEMTCKVEVKADGSGIQYQPYMIATGERVDVPEDYDVEKPGDNGSSEETSGGGDNDASSNVTNNDGSVNNNGIGDGENINENTNVVRAEMKMVDYGEWQMVEARPTSNAVTYGVRSAGAIMKTSASRGEMVVTTPADTKSSLGVVASTDDAEVLGETLETLGSTMNDENDDWGIWGILISVLGAAGALIMGWWLFLIWKRRREEDEED